MKEKKSILAAGVVVGIGLLALIVFATLSEVQVTAQQQTTPTDAHHAENNSNQSGNGMTERRTTTTTAEYNNIKRNGDEESNVQYKLDKPCQRS